MHVRGVGGWCLVCWMCLLTSTAVVEVVPHPLDAPDLVTLPVSHTITQLCVPHSLSLSLSLSAVIVLTVGRICPCL